MKELVNFRGYRVAKYWSNSNNIHIDYDKQRINKHGNVSYTGYLNLNDAIKTKNDEDIDFKAKGINVVTYHKDEKDGHVYGFMPSWRKDLPKE